jgi:hypothetical protein
VAYFALYAAPQNWAVSKTLVGEKMSPEVITASGAGELPPE